MLESWVERPRRTWKISFICNLSKRIGLRRGGEEQSALGRGERSTSSPRDELASLCCACWQCQERGCEGLKMAPTSQQNGSRMSGSCLLLQRGIKPSRVLCSLWLVQALLLQEMMLLGSPSGAGEEGRCGPFWGIALRLALGALPPCAPCPRETAGFPFKRHKSCPVAASGGEGERRKSSFRVTGRRKRLEGES